MKRKEITLSKIFSISLLLILFFTISFNVFGGLKLNKTESYLQDNGMFMGVITIGGHQIKLLQDDGTGNLEDCSKINLDTESIATDKEYTVPTVWLKNEDQGSEPLNCYVRWKFVATIDGDEGEEEININPYCTTSNTKAFIYREDSYYYYIDDNYDMASVGIEDTNNKIPLFDKILFTGEYNTETNTYGSVVDKYFSGSNFKLTLVVEVSNEEWDVQKPEATFVVGLDEGTEDDVIIASSLDFTNLTTVPSPTGYETIEGANGTTLYFEGWRREGGGIYQPDDTVVLQEYDRFTALYSRTGDLISQATLVYEPNGDGTYTITGLGENVTIADGNLIIQNPSDGEQLTVLGDSENSLGAGGVEIIQVSAQNSSITTIGANAFKGCTKLTTVTLPDTVETIGERAFSGCTSLTTITLPSNLETIGAHAFSGCTKLANIAFPSSLRTIGDWAFQRCKFTELNFPEGITDIGMYTFVANNSLTTVTIPTTLTSLKSGAFAQSIKLKTVYIPSTVTSIDSYAFGGCTALTNFVVDEANQNYSVDNPTNGSPILYNKEKTQVVSYSSASGVWDVPENVKYISVWAIGFNTNITGIVLHPSVNCACYFNSCPNLTTITVKEGSSYHKVGTSTLLYNKAGTAIIAYPSAGKDTSGVVELNIDGVTTINSNAFGYNNNITSITFSGGITKINTNALIGSSNVISLTFGASVTQIGKNICPTSKLESVVFEDTANWGTSSSSSGTSKTAIESSALTGDSALATFKSKVGQYWFKG